MSNTFDKNELLKFEEENRAIVADFYAEHARAMAYTPSQSEELDPIAFFSDEG